MQINEGDEVPQSLSEYGDFSKIDISNCKLDTSEVKNNVPGNYTYYVMCNGSKYSESFCATCPFPVAMSSAVSRFSTKETMCSINSSGYVGRNFEYSEA